MDEAEFWKLFQTHMGYTDEELAIYKSDPKHVKKAPRYAKEGKDWLAEMSKKYLVIEVVSSHGCAEQMKVGDRLVFKGMAKLDPKRSDPWCIYATQNMFAISAMCHDRWNEGLDPNDMLYDHFSCFDCGVRNGGWGQVAMKAYVVDESEL